MEPVTVETDFGGSEKCNTNGTRSVSANKQCFDLNHSNNIDDISTPSDLKFDEEFDYDNPIDVEKRKLIEGCLENPLKVSLEEWQALARGPGGLLSDKYRRRIWPLLLGVTEEEMTEPPSLEDLSTHTEYNQVVLDVGRSLKRFPPGVPYARRLALQDQLTVLILRVIILYPHLKYYQGYHDVAITLLLVCGARAAFPLLCRLSHPPPAAPLAPFMAHTMQPTQHRLNYMLPLLKRAHPAVAERMALAGVGTMFALPWYLTWFGHSLPRYAAVVRLYDYFLCEPPLQPVYVTAAVVMYRADEIFETECDMAMLHCLLSRLPDSLPWDSLLDEARDLYGRFPPEGLEKDVIKFEQMEEEQRRQDEERMRRRALARRGGRGAAGGRWWASRGVRGYTLAAAAALLGAALYWRHDLLLS